MHISIYQTIFVLVGVIMIIKAISHFLRHRKSWRELVVWLSLWGGVIAFSLYSGFNNSIMAIFFAFSLIVLYTLARVLLKIEQIEKKLIELARAISFLERK